LSVNTHPSPGAEAQYLAFIDSQKATDVPVTEVTLDSGKLVLKVAAIGAEYRADLNGNTLAGQWTQGPFSNPLTLTRD
jgi:hypothetical protein